MAGSPPRVSSEEARAIWSLLFACALVLLPRLAVFPWSENLYGDAVVRTELAQRWLQNPHWIAHMDDGAFQYGPLHVYLVAGALALGIDREDAGRWVSLLFGVLTVLPLWSLTRRLGGAQAAWWATAGLALWGMHIQMSTTGGSESVGLFFVLWSLALLAEGLEENRFPPLFGSALVLNLACAIRYDCWLLIPLLCVLLLLGDRDRVAAVTRSVCYGLLAMPFVAAWMQGNERAKGDPFAPIRYIESFHRAWVADGVARWTSVGYRAQNLLFWPGVALLTLSPLIAWFGMRGMRRILAAAPGVPVADLGRAHPDRVLRVPERGAARLRAPGAVRGDAGGAAPAVRGRGLPGDGGRAVAARAARLGGGRAGSGGALPGGDRSPHGEPG